MWPQAGLLKAYKMGYGKPDPSPAAPRVRKEVGMTLRRSLLAVLPVLVVIAALVQPVQAG